MSDKTTCAVIGGGPAGTFLGLLLARAGIEVTVLEKHGDFLRDFRGDTVHPATMRLLAELGLFEQFNTLPHSCVDKAQLDVDGHLATVADFRRLHRPHPYVAMAPQWDLLELITETAPRSPLSRCACRPKLPACCAIRTPHRRALHRPRWWR